MSKSKQLAEDNSKFDKNGVKFSIRVKNTVGGKEKLLNMSDSPFRTEFSNDLYYRHVRTQVCLGKACTMIQFNSVKDRKQLK